MTTYRTPGPLTLKLHVPAGSIELETVDGEETHVELEPLHGDEGGRTAVAEARIELRERALGGHELVVEVPERRWLIFDRTPEVSLLVRCPHGAAVDLQTTSADVEARGRFAAVSSQTASGDLSFEEIDGDVQLKSVSGDVRLERVDGSTEVRTVSGDVLAGRMAGPGTVSLVSGDLTVREAGSSLSANSVSGDQRVDAVREGAVTLHSVSGDVAVSVRPGLQLWVDASSMSGDVSSELEVSDTPPESGGPLVELRVKTMSGDIQVSRAPASAELRAG